MSRVLSNVFSNLSLKTLEEKFINLSLQSTSKIQARGKLIFQRPRLRNPSWFTRKTRVIHRDDVTSENIEFIQEVIKDKYGFPTIVGGGTVGKHHSSPLQGELITQKEWNPKCRRTGLIAKKIGNYPLWFDDGTKVLTTLLQVLDNHVIKYYTPDEFDPPRKPIITPRRKLGCLLLGAESMDPSLLTKEYCGLFKNSGVIPKKYLGRFFISPDAILPVGSLLNINHFKVGEYVDVRGKTIDRGFQGVMKRWGFKGMPATHGVTKTHRRPGNIGGGGEKARVWPGKKMPGHMGNRYRIAKGLKILRVNTKYNVMWVKGVGIPGETNSIVYIFDTKLPLRKSTEGLPLPTFLQDGELPEDIYDDKIYRFDSPTISFSVD